MLLYAGNRTMSVMTRFWRCERGDSSVLSMIFITTILAIGAIVGLSTVRMHVVQQLGDIAVALENLDQSFSLALPTGTVVFNDTSPPLPLLDPNNAAPACLNVQVAASDEAP